MDERHLRLDPDEAVDLKFAQGRARHGGEWVGERPILEAHAEILDALAYLREEAAGHTNGFPGDPLPENVLRELIIVLLNALQGIRILIETSGALHGSQNGSEEGGGTGPTFPDASG